MVAHVNDTGEQLPGMVVRHPTSEKMKSIALRSVFCKATPQVMLDFRLPQTGLARRTAQKRYPQKQQAQRRITASVFGIAATAPDLEQRLENGQAG
jgi:hypothetical protein